jgi:putative ABC transport system ATP-binding protein
MQIEFRAVIRRAKWRRKETMDVPVIELNNVLFGWDAAAASGNPTCIDIPAMSVQRGETVLLRGPSGSGKSTLLALLGGVIAPASGRVRILDHDFSALSPTRRDRIRADHIGMLFQQFNLISYLSVFENVLLPCRFSARRRATASAGGTPTAAAERLLHGLDIEPALWPRQVTHMSMGQQQRAAIARAMIGRPEIIIADEPTSALDAARRDAFVALLLRQCADAGATLLFASHDEDLAPRFGRVIDMTEINRAAASIGNS